MANLNKRRFVTQLPAVLQTDVLKNFFAATIDNLFQPGASEAISGYIGQKPSYYDALKDFYVPEASATRAAYQLEPAMVSTNGAGEMSHSLCYDDLINYMRSQGSDVSNHNRLFDGEYYSWSPPVDLDKLNNPRQYVWMGDLSPEEERRSALVLRAPRLVSGYAGDSTFPLPPANPAYQGQFEYPVVLVNGFPARASFTSSNATVIGSLNDGDRIETVRYGDLTLVINGHKDFDFSYFMAWSNEISDLDANGDYRTNITRTYRVGEIVWARQDVTTPYKAWRCVAEHSAGSDFAAEHWTTAQGAEKATSGLSVRLQDGIGAIAAHAPEWSPVTFYAAGARVRYEGNYYSSLGAHTSEALFDVTKWQNVGSVARRFFVDGVGTKIELTADYTIHSGGRVPHHIVMDRRSREDSPWTQRNLWVHKSALAWTGLDFNNRQALRPIIEFLPDIELFNYGTRRIENVNATLSTEKARVRDNYDLYPYDVLPWQEEDINVSRINGQPIGYLSYYKKNPDGTYVLQPNGQPVKERRMPFGCVEVDAFNPTTVWSAKAPFEKGERIIVGNSFYESVSAHVSTESFKDDADAGKWVRVDGYLLKPGDRLLVRQTSTNEPELNNLVYRVVANYDVELAGIGGEADVLELIAEAPPERGDIIRVLRNGETSVFADSDEYWFDGEKWLLAQTGASAPLFMLYDADQNRLSDDSIYVGTDFAGSRLFGFKQGSGSPDSVLGFSIENNQYAQPIFELDATTRRTKFEGGEIGGYYYHHFLAIAGDGEFSNNWFPVEEPSSQAIVNGVYEIPLNLQANPGNEEVTFISRNEWFDHFSNVMTEQDGFEGHPYAVNNWRDTAKNLGNGNKILQHRSPLLKTMLVASDSNFDMLGALRYVEQEYTRYRYKFVQKAIEFRNSGTLTDADEPEVWAQAIIESLRLNKSADFPFALSRGAGDQFFIPPTPAALGIGSNTQPFLMDGVLRCHDGAEVPTFGDFRDAVMLAFEQRVYDNIPEQFKTDARPIFDLARYVEGHWFKNSETGYTRDEMNAIMAPMFERWAQNQRLDYRTNTSYSPSDPFSWNYSTCVDANGNAVAGNYRGIYNYYFDTDRPHVAPWEMLGFAEEPSWWVVEYGSAPYTMGNDKMWEDLRDGRVASGSREGIDHRYARPTLLDMIPVDDEGNLIDPVTLGIVDSAPTNQNAMKAWKFGDGGTVETLWRSSPSYAFAMAQAGFLMKPSRFVEQCWDTLNIIRDASGQWIYLPTGNRPLNSMVTVHGEFLADGSRYYGSGVQQWISDFMVSKGQNPSLLGAAVRGLGVRLAHKVGGFTSSESIRVLADNFGLVPSEDVSIELYRSPSISEEVYSGVLIEWTGAGWRVIGYDVRTPSFKIDPGLTTGPKGVISLAPSAEPAFNVWSPNVYYPTNTRVVHDNVFYEAIKPNTSGTTFEGRYWKALGPMKAQAPRVSTYRLGTGEIETIPYGTVFDSYQAVADFLLGYERYLVRRGWVFDDVEDDAGTVRDWSAVTKEFLAWAQVTWEQGSFITLSPSAEGARFNAEHGMVLDTLNAVNGAYGLVDRTGYPIDRRNVVVNRIDGECSLASKDSDLFGARLHIGEIEHVLFFSNKTIFGDIIYAPLFNLRQPRLRLIGNRSTDWTGRLDAPGYVLIDGEIVSNFHKASEDLQTMFDIEKADNAELRDHARHVIGYDSRSYFQSLVLSETEQFEFYQGMIHQKGAPGAFSKLMRSDYIEQSRDLRFFEEWAIKIDEFGALGGRSRASFLLGSSSLRNEPQMIQFRNTGDPTLNAEWQELIDIGVNIDKKWVERPKNPMITFPQHTTYAAPENALPMSGYVRTNEVDHTIWSIDDLGQLQADGLLGLGSRVWIHNYVSSNIQANAPVWSLSPRDDPNLTQPDANIEEGWLDANGNVPSIAPYLFTQENGTVAFRSKKCESPFVTTETFTPVVGNRYTAEFPIRKTFKETNGKAILRPGFDAFRDGVNVHPGRGEKSGVGYNAQLDAIDTTDWEIGRWYYVKVVWEPTENYDYARERIRINRALGSDDARYFRSAANSNAVFEMEQPSILAEDTHGWQVLQVFAASTDGEENTVVRIETTRENSQLPTHITRMILSRDHGLTDANIGATIIVDGGTQTEIDLGGIQTISNAAGNWIDILADNNMGIDFVTNSIQGPEIRLMRPVRFKNEELMNQHRRLKGVKDGDVVYLDGATENDPWRVYRRKRTRLGLAYWESFRRQPYRVNAKAISSALVYDLKTKITTDSISPEPLVLHHFDVISPANGIIVGRAEREIDFKLNSDPANYSDTGWGQGQIGRVWWDISRVRFLETETDYVIFGQSNEQRFETEATYRSLNWGKIAQGTRVDIYEWTRQKITPSEWMVAKAKSKDKFEFEGVPYGFVGKEDSFDEDSGETFAQIPSDVPYITRVEWDSSAGRDVEVYYYWMSGISKKPNVPFRNLDIAAVKQIITSPLAQDVPWIAPILQNSLVVGGLSSHLDDYFDLDAEIKRSGTVVQVEIDEDPENDGVIHDEWLLLRPNDERSLPPEWLWEQMRDSLVGFDNSLNVVPAPPEIVIGEAPVTNGPIFEEAPYKLEGIENEPYYPNIEDDDD